jgi:hypothetical protein
MSEEMVAGFFELTHKVFGQAVCQIHTVCSKENFRGKILAAGIC